MREADLLQYVYTHTDPSEHVPIGPGDDMAVVSVRSGDVLIAVDQLVAGRHVNLATTPLAAVGRKAVTRCLSDVAAMAGRPVAALAAVVLPPDFGTTNSRTLFDAMRETAATFGCPLVGGDIAFHAIPDHPLTVTVTVLAEPGPAGVVTRGGAEVGDRVYVTGQLGGTIDAAGGGHHLTFTPRIPVALTLAEQLGVRLHAMIDLSDGLGRDGARLAAASGVTLTLTEAQLPRRGNISWRAAVSDGEDYELLICAAGDVPSDVDGVTITEVGRVVATSGSSRVTLDVDGDAITIDEMGWQHEA